MGVMKSMTSMMKNTRSYSELITIPTFRERYEYLRLEGQVGKETFGFDRYLNQMFYNSLEWKRFRRDIIMRDNGCDLGIEDREIQGVIMLHHINPIDPDDIVRKNLSVLLNPDNVISTSFNTHQSIHYGDGSILIPEPIVRTKNDTCPWRR